jgi:hypothetical protein
VIEQHACARSLARLYERAVDCCRSMPNRVAPHLGVLYALLPDLSHCCCCSCLRLATPISNQWPRSAFPQGTSVECDQWWLGGVAWPEEQLINCMLGA